MIFYIQSEMTHISQYDIHHNLDPSELGTYERVDDHRQRVISHFNMSDRSVTS